MNHSIEARLPTNKRANEVHEATIRVRRADGMNSPDWPLTFYPWVVERLPSSIVEVVTCGGFAETLNSRCWSEEWDSAHLYTFGAFHSCGERSTGMSGTDVFNVHLNNGWLFRLIALVYKEDLQLGNISDPVITFSTQGSGVIRKEAAKILIHWKENGHGFGRYRGYIHVDGPKGVPFQ